MRDPEGKKSVRVLTLLLVLLAAISPAQGSSFKVLHSFAGSADGCLPIGGVVLDMAGNVYGVTSGGARGLCGNQGSDGTVFEIANHGGYSVLYKFLGGSGGAEPAALVLDGANNLWGTTLMGGLGGGVIFEVVPSRDKERLIYTFGEHSQQDGCDAYGAMITNGSGDFFGTTLGCGKRGGGTVFELKPHGRESVRYSFKGGVDGFGPQAGPVIDSEGNLYGTTNFGGKGTCLKGEGCGTIFRLAADRKEAELYKFQGPRGDGYEPSGTLLLDSSGNLYGTTFQGGHASCGIVFELAPAGTESVVHFFEGKKNDGCNPQAGLIVDAAGNLYGTTVGGGGQENCYMNVGCGTVFKIAPDGSETILHKFKAATDGANPMSRLVADGSGHLYGTATYGGKYGYGTVFEITP